MKAIKRLLTCVLVLSASAVSSSEGPTSLVGNAGGHAFSVSVPDGWMVVSKEGSGSANGATLLFDLLPPDSRFANRIRFAHYPNGTPLTAQLQWERQTSNVNVELPRINHLPAWVVLGQNRAGQQSRIKSAYFQLYAGTLVISIYSDDDMVEGLLLETLKSFRDLGKASATVSPNSALQRTGSP